MSAERGHGSKSRVHFLGYSLFAVGVSGWVRFDPLADPLIKLPKKLRKTPEIRRFQVFFGAADQIRTGDLILTNGEF